MVADLANQSLAVADTASPHPLSALPDNPTAPENDAHPGIIYTELETSITAYLTPGSPASLLHYVDV